MSIFDVHHQPRAHRLIQRALSGDRMPHAYVFHGPEGVGRELFARRLGQALLCEQPARGRSDGAAELGDWSDPVVDACGACASCRLAGAGTHPDLHLIYRELIRQHPDPRIRARKGIDLGVDVIREFVIQRAANRPVLGRGKVFIIREAEKMNAAAQNALLKTLEEPPATTFLMLLSTSLDALLPTTRSRCQLVPFGSLPQPFIVERLRSAHGDLSPVQADLCATFANGSLGAAMRYRDDGLIDYHARMEAVLSDLPGAGITALAKRIMQAASELGGTCKQRDEDISDTEALRRGLKTLLLLASTWYRTLLHRCVGSDVLTSRSDSAGGFERHASTWTPSRAVQAIRTIATADRQLDLSANVQLCLEALLIRLARLAAG